MEGKKCCEERSKYVCLSAEQMKQTLTPFYETVALVAGYEVKQEDMFDCTKVNVAANVQDNIIAAYQEKDASLEKSSVISVLLLAGPAPKLMPAYRITQQRFLMAIFVKRKELNL